MKTPALSPEASGAHDHDGFDLIESFVRNYFAIGLADYGPAVFTTDAADLFETYLDAFPTAQRQHHNCSACRTFINRFGGLVFITETGETRPAMWSGDADGLYGEPIRALARAVRSARVDGVFFSKEPEWGTAVTGDWTHFAVRSPSVFSHPLETAGQAMALKREHFGTLSRALAEFKPADVAQALTLLEADALYRTEKVIGPARFLHEIHTAQAAAKGKDAKRNVVWRALAPAPPGFCTPRSSMIGTLLEDIIAGLPFEDVKKKFAAKMHPLAYMRPQAAATEANIKQAEEIVSKLGIAASLRRRFARFEEIQTIWKPAAADAPKAEDAGVFGHLKPKGAAPREPMAMSPVAITWAKFRDTVLPQAVGIEVFMTYTMPFAALVTAVDPDAPPILRWDRPEARNPVSLYTYTGGSAPARWGLTNGAWVPVTGIALRPEAWNNPESDAKSVMLILQGARETSIDELALFPETLRAELHAIRKTIEQFSKAGRLEGMEEASACGLLIPSTANLRVRTALGTANYTVDRWD